ncbi:MAG: hypothetical protein ABIH89_07055 [Elusimicrobiota bacterium]
MKRIILVFLIVASFIRLEAAESPLSEIFFAGEIPNSAAIGRGMAYCAVTPSPYAPYWNPGGLVKMQHSMLGVSFNLNANSYTETHVLKDSYPLEGRSLNFISVCGDQVGIYWRPLSSRIDYSSWTVSGIKGEETIEGKISMCGVTVAVPHNELVDFGMNINYISGIIGVSRVEGNDVSLVVSDGYGWGLDWGLIYSVTPNVNMGLTLLNCPAYIYWEDYDKDRLPVFFRTGFDIRLAGLAALGIDYANGPEVGPATGNGIFYFGIEQYVKNNIIARAGVSGKDFNDAYKTMYTAGLGFSSNGYGIDIAFRHYYLDNNESSKVTRSSVSGVVPF